MDNNDNPHLTEMTAEIVAAYVANNSVGAEEFGALIANVHAALRRPPGAGAEPAPEPAVSIRKSVTPDYLVCLEDGKKFKSLKRHLQGEHGVTPAEYREKWGLKPDYPMTAPSYTASRSALAKSIGLGRKAVAEATPPKTKPARSRRKRPAAAPA